MNAPQRQAIFRPEVYEVNTVQQAMSVTVTGEAGTSTEERWEKETAYLLEDIGRHLEIDQQTCVLDYGCGVGRLSKALIDEYGCRVVGVDASKSMRLLAPEYVLSERFTVWSPEVLAKMVDKGFRIQRALCLWVLQHVLNPAEVVQLIGSALSDGGLLYVLNQLTRCVPTNLGYVNDRKDVEAELEKRFDELNRSSLPAEVTTQQIAQASRISVLRKPETPTE